MRISDVGSLAWARRTNGRVSVLDKLELLRQGALVRFHAGRSRPIVADTPARVPDSYAARLAAQELADTSPAYLVNHAHRSFHWACALGQQYAYDPELLYIACLLHDMGLVEAGSMGSECFSVDGALYAEGFASHLKWDARRSDALAESLSLHLNLYVPVEYGIEAHLLNAGAACDVAGLHFPAIPLSMRAAVLAKHPRSGFKRNIGAAMQAEAGRRPCCRMHFMASRMCFLDLIANAPYAE